MRLQINVDQEGYALALSIRFRNVTSVPGVVLGILAEIDSAGDACKYVLPLHWHALNTMQLLHHDNTQLMRVGDFS